MSEPRDPTLTADIPPADPSSAGPASVLSGLRETLGELPPVILKEADGEGPHPARPDSDALPPGPAGGRYRLYGEIARGGMGAVLRGRDVDLGRDLAIKVLLDKHAHRPDVARRFLEEAQVGAQLQHPGVVPVYDVGRFGGRPFFTMKLVQGKTLAAVLRERASPSADRPRLLGIALQVAQALAYAHAKGVIHRDLKPSNVMVGAFGEVQVMDWGLAKVLQEGDAGGEEQAGRQDEQPHEAPVIHTARGGPGTDTEAGTLLGTPAYMPPEQARGDIARLDRRADVFGLGAILCEILTGRPPYVSRSPEEVRRKAADGDLADAGARLAACGADRELLELTGLCLAPEAADRPADAGAVAEALAAYLGGVQDRLRRAELAEAAARAKAAEEAKRRRLTVALAATVLLALTGGGGGWLWFRGEREARQARLAREVNEALTEATALRERARAAPAGGAALFAQAREQAQRALALVGSGPADERLKARVRQLQAELDEEEKDHKLVAALDEARLAQAETVTAANRFADERAVPKFREALRAYGLPPGGVEPKAAAERVRQRPAATREAILSALDEWDDLATNPDLRLREPHREWLRAVLRAAEPDGGWTRAFREAREQPDPARRRAALERLAAADDVGKLPARTLSRLATRLKNMGALESAVTLLRRAQQRYPDDFSVNHQLGMTLQRLTPPDRAAAVRFLTAAVALRPDSPGARINLGTALTDEGQVEEAIACFRRALALDPKYAAAHGGLGNALGRKGQADGAIACFRRALALDPKDFRAMSGLGSALLLKGQVDKAIACFRRALALDPNNAGLQHNLGAALEGKGHAEEATACFRRALDLDPKYTPAHVGLGNALAGKGRLEEASACYRRALALDPKLALAHNGLGAALLHKGQVDEAIASFRKALDLDPRLAPARTLLPLAERLAAVQGKLPALRKGEYTPADNAERLTLAELCRLRKLYHTAARLYAEVLAADPKRADAPAATYLRSNAANAAALAAAGKGEDAANLSEEERARLRRQALTWLRADLAMRQRQLERGAVPAAVWQMLRHWRQDTGLASARDPAALARLPAEERAAWETFWADVAALLKQAEERSE